MTPFKIPDEEIGYVFKIVIIGAPGVGKTCLFNRFCFNSFNMNTEMTIGINFHSTYLRIKFNEGTNRETYVANSIFDFGGQDRFKSLIPRFIEGASGALILFDSVGFSSFQQLDFWYNNLTENVDDSIPIILIGTKSDLLDSIAEAEIVSQGLIDDYLKERQLDAFYRTSALENYNVLEAFKELTYKMLKKRNVNASVL